MLQAGTPLAPGSREEISVRAASIVAVEKVRDEITQMKEENQAEGDGVTSVLIDFYLWDLAKKIESGEKIEDTDTVEMLPAHRTRSIWY